MDRSRWILASHMPLNANLAFREFGIALFFAAVGLAAGPTFFTTDVSPTGVAWMLAGVCVTTLPLIAVGSVARAVWKMNVRKVVVRRSHSQ